MDGSITFRVDADVKRKMNDICKRLGITPSAAMSVFVNAFVREEGMPFAVSLRESAQTVPSEELDSIMEGLLERRADAYRRLSE